MKWKHFLLSFFLSAPLFAKGADQSLGVYDFSKGLDTYHSSLSLPDGFVQDSQNVFFDSQAPVSKRKGYTVSFSSKSYAYQNAWTYTDQTNTTWIIVRASDSIIASNIAGTVVRISTVSANDVVGEANAFGSAYFVDPTQAVYAWNGSSTTYIAGSPHGSLIAQFHSRLFVSGAAVPNGSQVYSSGFLVGTNWTLGPNASDPVQLTAGLQDNFDNVTAMYAYLDTLYLFKHYAIYSLSGFDQTSFQVSFVSSECGCIDQNSIQTFGGALKFVSLRGVENFDGYRCTRISDPIKDKVDPAIQIGGFSQSSWVQSQAPDWSAGTFSPSGSLSTTVQPPTLVLSTQAALSSVDSNWNAGTSLVNVDSTTNAPALQLGKTTTSTTSPSYVGGINTGVCATPGLAFAQSFTSDNVSNMKLSSVFLKNVTAPFSSGGTTLRIKSDNAGVPGTDLATASIAQGASGPTVNISVALSANTKYWIYIDGAGSGSCGSIESVTWATQTGNPYAGGNFWTSVSGNFTTDATFSVTYTVPVFFTSGSFQSQVFNVGFPTSAWLWSWGNFQTSETDNGQTITYQTKTSNDGVTFDAPVTATPGSPIASATKPFIVYIANLSGTTTATPVLNSVTVQSTQLEKSSGTIKSQSHNVSPINSWGNFAVTDSLNGGNIVFSVCSSSSANMVPSVCAAQSPNTPITIATNTFVNWYSTFSVTLATQTPTLNSVTVQWFSGNKAIPLASTVWDNRYWLSLTTSTLDSSNDAVLVLANSGAWADLDIHASGLVQYKNSLYHSDSLGTGNVYLDNQGYQDNGNPINAYFKTKDYMQGDLTQDNFLDSIWPSMDNAGPYNVSVSYFPDRAATGYSLGQISMSDFAYNASEKMVIPIDSTHQVFGKSMAYFFQASDANSPWNFYGFREIFHARPTQ